MQFVADERLSPDCKIFAVTTPWQNSWPMTYVFLITNRPSILPQSNITF